MAMMPRRTSRRTLDLTSTEEAVEAFYDDAGGLVDQPLTPEDLASHTSDTAERRRVDAALQLGQFAAEHVAGSQVASEATGVIVAPQFEQPVQPPPEHVGRHRAQF